MDSLDLETEFRDLDEAMDLCDDVEPIVDALVARAGDPDTLFRTCAELALRLYAGHHSELAVPLAERALDAPAARDPANASLVAALLDKDFGHRNPGMTLDELRQFVQRAAPLTAHGPSLQGLVAQALGSLCDRLPPGPEAISHARALLAIPLEDPRDDPRWKELRLARALMTSGDDATVDGFARRALDAADPNPVQVVIACGLLAALASTPPREAAELRARGLETARRIDSETTDLLAAASDLKDARTASRRLWTELLAPDTSYSEQAYEELLDATSWARVSDPVTLGPDGRPAARGRESAGGVAPVLLRVVGTAAARARPAGDFRVRADREPRGGRRRARRIHGDVVGGLRGRSVPRAHRRGVGARRRRGPHAAADRRRERDGRALGAASSRIHGLRSRARCTRPRRAHAVAPNGWAASMCSTPSSKGSSAKATPTAFSGAHDNGQAPLLPRPAKGAGMRGARPTRWASTRGSRFSFTDPARVETKLTDAPHLRRILSTEETRTSCRASA